MKKLLSTALSLVLIAALLCGCGNRKAAYDAEYESADAYRAYDNYGKSAGVSEEAYGLPAEKESADLYTPGENTKLIYTADIDMETTDFAAAQKALEKLTADCGGFFQSSTLSGGDYRYGSYVIRIPAEKFADFCMAVGEGCQVNSLHRDARDVSELYYDSEARLATQQTKLERLQKLLSEATNMTDIIQLESAISETELTIENLTGTLRKYDSLVNFASVSVSLREVYRLSHSEEPAIGFGAKLLAAFRAGCTNFVEGLGDLLLGFARGWVGWLLFAAAVVAVIKLLPRLWRRVRQHKKSPEDPAPKD